MRKRSAFRRSWGALLAGALAAGMALPALASDAPPRLRPIQNHAPPEDFLSGMLREPDCSAKGSMTQTAFIPIKFEEQGGEWVWEGEVPIDSAEAAYVFFMGEGSMDWDIEIQPTGEAPMGRDSFRARADTYHKLTDMSLGRGGEMMDAFATRTTAPGLWRFRVASSERPAARSGDSAHGGELMVSNDSPEMLYIHPKGYDMVVGERFAMNAYMMDYDALQALNVPMEHALERSPASRGVKLTGILSRVTATVHYPDLTSREFPMFDDGRHEDGAVGDGVYGFSTDLDMAGNHLIRVQAVGRNFQGREFIRTGVYATTVVDRPMELEGNVIATPESDTTLRLDFPARVSEAKKVRMAAEVWGKDERGQDLPICWIGCVAMPRVEEGVGEVVQMRLDARWITYAGAQGPFELRNVRMQEYNYFIPISRIESAPLRINRMPERASGAVASITKDMREGFVSEAYSLPLTDKAKDFWERNRAARGSYSPQGDPGIEVGSHTLFLTHGYCSGDVFNQGGTSETEWQENVGQYWTGDHAFLLDYGMSHSHSEFAEVLYCATEELKSFGLVGHSQGGPASLTLYNDFCSGLQWSRGPGTRLIQSVGSPYQGSPLADGQAIADGIAWLLQIDPFANACPVSLSLSPISSAFWLLGIDSAHRAGVYYYATMEADDSWFFDHCNTASGIFMSGPDDGAVPLLNTPLSGATSMGVTSGQCHTYDMNDPPQCGNRRRADEGSVVTHMRTPTFNSNGKR